MKGDGSGVGGTITHIPLEYLTGEAKYPAKEGDVWSFGVTVWQIFTLCKEKPYIKEEVESSIQMLTVLKNGIRLKKPQLFENLPSLWDETFNYWQGRKPIGKGRFGYVYRCYCKEFNKEVMVKELISKDKMVYMKFCHEIETISGLRHPNVTRILGVDCVSNLRIVISLRNSTLTTYLSKSENLDRKDLIRFSIQIIDAMIYLHLKNIIHGDLRTCNILVKDEFTVEVTDFGFTGIMGDSNKIGGTWTHMPIEYLTRDAIEVATAMGLANQSAREAKHPTKEGDVWSFGVTVWQIFTLCKDTPYSEHNISSEFKMIEVLTNGARLSKPALFQDFPYLWSEILSCFSEDPEMRPTFNHLYSKFARVLPIYSPPVEQLHQVPLTRYGLV
ncbi:hypothetical protein FO519_009580 [Halicephalobus sp. NKZ332]|nr:hypothetical protein FO519_009580 [Halicephalobus sp. NKZ332]